MVRLDKGTTSYPSGLLIEEDKLSWIILERRYLNNYIKTKIINYSGGPFIFLHKVTN